MSASRRRAHALSKGGTISFRRSCRRRRRRRRRRPGVDAGGSRGRLFGCMRVAAGVDGSVVRVGRRKCRELFDFVAIRMQLIRLGRSCVAR